MMMMKFGQQTHTHTHTHRLRMVRHYTCLSMKSLIWIQSPEESSRV